MVGCCRRRAGSPKWRPWPSTVPVLIVSVLSILFPSVHLCSWALWQANSLGRTCIPGDNGYRSTAWAEARIAMVSFSDEGRGGGEVRRMGRTTRTFEGLNELVESNKKDYAQMWGYDYINTRSTIDKSRPASWSKIPAVRSHLRRYDWIFWNDADSLVTNPNITLQRILRSVDRSNPDYNFPDLIVTEDVNGINAGMFLVRRTRWSEEFLDAWWNMTMFVTRGSTRSGDNAALIHLIGSLGPEERRRHVYAAPMQCMFNSYPWVPTPKSFLRLIFSPSAFWRGAYSEGDFMVHLAGLDDKKGWAIEVLRRLKASSSPWSSFVYGLSRYHTRRDKTVLR